jgi:hypothetical protein
MFAHKKRERLFLQIFGTDVPTPQELADEDRVFWIVRQVRQVLKARLAVVHAVQRSRYYEGHALRRAMQFGERRDRSRFDRLNRRYLRLSDEYRDAEKIASYFLPDMCRAKSKAA